MSTASTLTDVANRVLETAGRALGRKWKDSASDLIKRVGLTITLTPEPGTGVIVPSLDLKLRTAPLEEQRDSLAKTLDAVDALAKARKTTIGIVLDEFQAIEHFGGESAEWHLRGIIQHHQHVSYVLAGSQAHIIARMLDKGRAFYGLADQLLFGPIEPAHLAAWIDDRMASSGVKAAGVGALIVDLAGPRTRDIVQVARQCFDRCRAVGRAGADDVAQAFEDVVSEQESPMRQAWQRLTAAQQNVLRAVATAVPGLTTADTMRRFGLGSSGGTTKVAQALIEQGHLVRTEGGSGYGFESPFMRRWVEREAMGDLGGGANR